MSHHDTTIEAVKASPTIAVSSLTLFGVGLSEYVLIATLIYTLFQLYFLLRDKWWTPRKIRNGRK